jgi:hypothetical protein
MIEANEFLAQMFTLIVGVIIGWSLCVFSDGGDQ